MIARSHRKGRLGCNNHKRGVENSRFGRNPESKPGEKPETRSQKPEEKAKPEGESQKLEERSKTTANDRSNSKFETRGGDWKMIASALGRLCL
jgi:hypothetical protein